MIFIASLKFRKFTRYGGEPEIKRLMIETGVNKTLIVEIYPLNITVSHLNQIIYIIYCKRINLMLLAVRP